MAGFDFPVVSRVPLTGGQSRPFHVLKCEACETEGRKSANRGRLPTDAVVRFFKEEGWDVAKNGRGTCPACIKKRETERRLAKTSKPFQEAIAMTTKMTPATFAAAKAEPAPEKSNAVKANLAELYLALDTHYDIAGKRYRPGYSDKKIADLVGLSEDFVRSRRENDFGPIAVDTFLRDLKPLLLQSLGVITETRERMNLVETKIKKALEAIADQEKLG